MKYNPIMIAGIILIICIGIWIQVTILNSNLPDCGHKGIDRDWNSAINIKVEGLRILETA